MNDITITCATTPTPQLQARLEQAEEPVRERHGLPADARSLGVVNLVTGEIAMINPDRIDYAASVPKIGILLAWFTLRPEATADLDPVVRHDLGLMIKSSSNEMASKYSRMLGIGEVQRVLSENGFYDPACGGGIWFGKHYGPNSERIGDPIANHSHAATLRQLLRFYVLLEQGKLVSTAASKTMRSIFESPDIAHDDVKFIKGLAGRNVQVIRKLGDWETWHLDTAVVTGEGRHYVVAAMTNHESGDAYLEDVARAVDDLMTHRE